MVSLSSQPSSIIRTERGLTIAGTRLSLYDILDCLRVGYTPQRIQAQFILSDEQMDSILTYIDANHMQLDVEYQCVLSTREEIYQYWTNRNRERSEQITHLPKKAEHERLWAKLNAQKAERLAGQQ